MKNLRGHIRCPKTQRIRDKTSQQSGGNWRGDFKTPLRQKIGQNGCCLQRLSGKTQISISGIMAWLGFNLGLGSGINFQGRFRVGTQRKELGKTSRLGIPFGKVPGNQFLTKIKGVFLGIPGRF